ncbi:MAG: type II secretion system F family protein [Candidatus Woesearchaeota archaeon]|nr:MAG: type II secretion system F family protein [Candidatus Woesearchaeota archaeon]
MAFKFKKEYLIGLIIGLLILIADIYFFRENRFFYTILIFSIVVVGSQIFMDFLKENKREQRIEENFLEFVRNLVETVRSGIPIPSAIIHISDKDYGALNDYIKKLASQIRLGIPIHEALLIFGEDTGNAVIKRSVAIVIEAEESGGDIEDVLEAVADSVTQVKKIKEERKSSTYSQIVQGYIIFFVFIGIMLVLDLKLFPTLLNLSGDLVGGIGLAGGGGATVQFSHIFFALIIIQGFFAGLMIGKFSEGALKYGVKHSFALIIIALLFITAIKGGFF